MSKKIPLQNGMFAIVDAEDYEGVNKNYWYLADRRKEEVAISNGIITLSAFLMGYPKKNNYYSHSNGDELDFRKNNLVQRTMKHAINKSGARKGSSSMYKGVSWNKRRHHWTANITVDGKGKYLGSFDNEVAAAYTYNENAILHFGKDAFQNTIGEDSRPANKRGVKKERGLYRKSYSKSVTSEFKGVSNKNNKYQAAMVHDDIYLYLGLFNKEEEAAKAYDKKAFELHGDRAILNFPEGLNE